MGILLLLIGVTGCANSCEKAGSEGLPLVSEKLPGEVVRVGAGKTVAEWRKRLKEGEMLSADFAMPEAAGHLALIFGTVNSNESGSTPMIWARGQEGWRGVMLMDLEGEYFVYAGAGPAEGEVFAITDHFAEGPGWDLNIIHSRDGGATWEPLCSVHKAVSFWAGFSGIQMAQSGKGSLEIALQGDSEETDGMYRYVTVDGGKTWRGPTFGQSALMDAVCNTPYSPTSDFQSVETAMEAMHKAGG